MATPSADYPVGRPVAPPPGAVRPNRPRPAPRPPMPPPEPAAARPSINWLIVGAAAGLAVLVLIAVVLFCAAARHNAPPIEVAANTSSVQPKPIPDVLPPEPPPPVVTQVAPAVV